MEATKEDIDDVLHNTSKMADAIAKIKKDRKLVTHTIDMLKSDPNMERNMTNIAREMAGAGSVMGPETSLKERKKMMHKQALIRSQMKMNLAEDDIRCTVLYPKGKGNPSPTVVNLIQLDKEEKWSICPATIGDADYLAICDATAQCTSKNLNKRATAIIGRPTYGLVTFVLLDEELNPIDSLAKDFPTA